MMILTKKQIKEQLQDYIQNVESSGGNKFILVDKAIQEIDREIAMRIKCYPAWIENTKKKEQDLPHRKASPHLPLDVAKKQMANLVVAKKLLETLKLPF